MPENTPEISEYDVRAMGRLMGKTAAIDGEHAEKKHFLMRELCELIKADAWIRILGYDLRPGGPHACGGSDHERFSEDGFVKYLRMLENPQIADAGGPFFAAHAKSSCLTTIRREEIDPDNRTRLLPDALQILREADVGPLIMNALPLDSNSISTIVVYRRNEAAPFTPRESRIAHIILSEVPWLHMSGWPEDCGMGAPRLFPQQRVVINLLLDGMDRKSIAACMDIAENTVAGYIKDIYRHFKIHSQAQLMRKFLSGNSHKRKP